MDQLRGCPQPQIHITRICLKAKSYKNSATLPDCVGKKASTVKRHIPFASWVTDSWKEQCKKLSDYAIRHQSTLTHEALYAVDSEIYQWLCSYKDLTDTDMSFEEWRKRHPETFPKLLKYDQTNKLMDYLDKALEGTPLSLSWHKIPDKPVTINSKTSELSDCEIFPFEEATPVDNFLELNNKELTAMSKQEMTTQLQACQSYIRQQASRILNLYHDYDVEYDTPLSDQDNQPTRKRQRRPSNNERQVATKKRCKQLEGVAARFVYIKSMVEKQHSGGIHCLCKEITSIIKDEKKFSENDTGMPSQVYPPKQITTSSTQT